MTRQSTKDFFKEYFKSETKMLLNLSPFQAYIVKNSLRSYNTELLTSSHDWKEFDNIFEQIADLSDTSSDEHFCKESNPNRHGRDLDSM